MALLDDTTATNVEVLDEIQTMNIIGIDGSAGNNSYYLVVDENGNIKWVAKANVTT